MILATDLDGTFLHGDVDLKQKLYRQFEEGQNTTLIFVTGRGVELIIPLLSDPDIPNPDYIIADVGATVVDGQDLQPVQPIQSEIESVWPGYDKVLDRFREVKGLVFQDVPQDHRCSFLFSGDIDWKQIYKLASQDQCEVVVSCHKYLDVLPKGVNKGSSLKRLVQEKELLLRDDVILTAGNTLNDLAMLEAGFPSVAVGNSDQDLLESTRNIPSVYHARSEGAGGILEAIQHFGMKRKSGNVQNAKVVPKKGSAQVVLSYHRLPYDEVERDGTLLRRPPESPNGIIPTLLNYFVSKKPGIWLAAYPVSKIPKNFEANLKLDDEHFQSLTISRVPLSKKDYTLFYKTFSKEAFWPIIFSFPDRAKFDNNLWTHYCRVNQLFAEHAAKQAHKGALVWIHDYNQWMVPAYLRKLRPDLNIAFFHHTTFPGADIFNIIPWSHEIVASLLKCDYIGFHIPRYISNFVQVAQSHAPLILENKRSFAPRFLTYGCALGIGEIYTRIKTGKHTVNLGAHPVGVNVRQIQAILSSETVQSEVLRHKRSYEGQKVVLSIERLDYVKGSIQKLLAFEQLLGDHPEWHGRISLINICPPAAEGIDIYRPIQHQIEQAVGRINGRFSQPGWHPVEFFFRAIPFEQIISYYALADICWVTPLRDGLNLVAKEYVAVCDKNQSPGVLILSEFAGVSTELRGALLTNPYHISNLAEVLLNGLTMDEDEAMARMGQMAETVKWHDSDRWGEEFLKAASIQASSSEEYEGDYVLD